MATKPAPIALHSVVDEFSKHIPYPVTPTNVPGVYSTPMGVTLASELPITHSLVATATGMPLLDANRIVPQLQLQPGISHFRVDSTKMADTAYTSGNWAGSQISGHWSSAVGKWVIPTVSTPPEAAGAGGGWWLSTWVGIDGAYGSNDVLQAGINQNVDTAGHVSCTAWYEWYCPFSKQTLPDTSPLSPALATLNGRIYLAWKGDGNDHINIMSSGDSGTTFVDKYTSPETTSQPPALVAHNGNLFVAWKGDGNDNINVARVTLAGDMPIGLVKQTLPQTSPFAPSLASFNGRLYVGWRGDGNDDLNIISSGDNGATFGNKLTSPENSTQAPALAAHNGTLYIAWKGDGNDNLNVARLNSAGNGLTNKVTVPDTSPLSPALASFGGRLYLAWKGDGNDNLNLMYSADNGATFTGKYISPETSPRTPALVGGSDYLFIGWKGDGNDNLNVAIVGLDAGVITGFTTPNYRLQYNIGGLSVSPGDTVSCSVAYVANNTAGALTFANVTTGKHVSLTLTPPPGATFSGNCSEWIAETPGFNNVLSSLAKFTTIDFSGCTCAGPNGAAGNPQTGDSTTITRGGKSLTAETLALDAVSITFQG